MTIELLKEKNRMLGLKLEILEEWLQDSLISDVQRELLSENIKTIKMIGENEISFNENMLRIEGFNYAIETSRS